MKYKYEIDYEGLKIFLETLYSCNFGIHDGHDKSPDKIEIGYTVGDIEKFRMDKTIIHLSQVIKIGMPFLVDALGNDLSICFLAGRKYKLPSGRAIYAKFDRTIINDCHTLYGTAINGMWIIPNKYIKLTIV